MKKIWIIFISAALFLSSVVPAFADSYRTNTQNAYVTEKDVLNAIDSIGENETKQIIIDFLTTPIYVENNFDNVEINYDCENEKSLDFIAYMSSLTKEQFYEEIQRIVDRIHNHVQSDSSSFYTLGGISLLSEYDQDFAENVSNEDIIKNTSVHFNESILNTMAVYPDRTRTKSNTWAYKSAATVVITGTMRITWVVKNSKITSSNPGFSYSVNKTFYKFSRWKTNTNSITNQGQRANVEITAYFNNVLTGIPRLMTPGVWVYNDGGCDFHMR